MAAAWTFYGYTAGSATTPANGRIIATGSSLSFGGGTRSSFQTNITINNWNTAMHYAKDTAEASVDYCASPHFWPMSPVALNFTGRTTASICDGEYHKLSNGSPPAYKGIATKFTYDYGVKCNPVQLWAGTAPTCAHAPLGCYIAVCDLTKANPAWSSVNASTKLTCSAHSTETSEHWWSFGIGVAPLTVGHIGENAVKIECVYY